MPFNWKGWGFLNIGATLDGVGEGRQRVSRVFVRLDGFRGELHDDFVSLILVGESRVLEGIASSPENTGDDERDGGQPVSAILEKGKNIGPRHVTTRCTARRNSGLVRPNSRPKTCHLRTA